MKLYLIMERFPEAFDLHDNFLEVTADKKIAEKLQSFYSACDFTGDIIIEEYEDAEDASDENLLWCYDSDGCKPYDYYRIIKKSVEGVFSSEQLDHEGNKYTKVRSVYVFAKDKETAWQKAEAMLAEYKANHPEVIL